MYVSWLKFILERDDCKRRSEYSPPPIAQPLLFLVSSITSNRRHYCFSSPSPATVSRLSSLALPPETQWHPAKSHAVDVYTSLANGTAPVSRRSVRKITVSLPFSCRGLPADISISNKRNMYLLQGAEERLLPSKWKLFVLEESPLQL